MREKRKNNSMVLLTSLLGVFLPFLSGVSCLSDQAREAAPREKTAFQTSGQWKPVTDVRSDVAIVYGAGDRPGMTFEERVQTWRDRGYTTHFMTGIAWGNYQDYFTGQWDGKWHLDEGQKDLEGDTIWHGIMVPYIVPSMNFIEYLKEKHVKRVIDAGIDAIYMEEPEFWARAGYSESFKREWEEYYGFPWRPQHESPENTYLSNKLKYHLYYRALDEVSAYAKEYGKSKGMDVRFYVPTHSLVNYSSWMIVSPEAGLASLPGVDGYIAQVWTGTSREPTYFDGVTKERVFENAFLEYGSMESMTRPTGRKMFFLTDPIEDWPRDWVDYKKNYQATFAAQLLYPMIADYEVMPWPDRIYEGLYNTCATCTTKERIPSSYSTQMQVMVNTLNDMPLSSNKVSGSHGIGVLMANSLMFQRYPTHNGYEDPMFSNFYGQTLPLLKRGIPISTVHIENVAYPDTWKGLKVLVMSYSNMKPMQAEYHKHIAQWVKDGGTLVYCGRDIDPYQSVTEWWNIDNNTCKAPSQHLFRLMELASDTPETGEYACGKGKVYVIREDPKSFVMNENGDRTFVNTVQKAFETAPNKGKLETKNNLCIERGPYTIAAVMDESVSDSPLSLEGVFIDLFDPALPVLTQKTIYPGEQAFLYDVRRVKNKKKPAVLCGASRVYDEVFKSGFYSFVAKSPRGTNNVSRVLLPEKPRVVTVKNAAGEVINTFGYDWDETSKTCLVTFENDPEGITVEVKWGKGKDSSPSSLVKVIVDTDIDSDVDDVGALAMLYNLHKQEKIDLIGVIVTGDDPYAPECVSALNTYYGMEHLPVGFLEGQPVLTNRSRYTKQIAEEYPHSLSSWKEAPSATATYRKLLAESPDHSVAILTIGHLSSLQKLLQSLPDEYSPLHGKELVEAKVRKWYCMGGEFPQGKEANFCRPDPASTVYCLDNWSKEVVFCGWEVGNHIITGDTTLKKLPDRHPVRRAYELYNNCAGRESWDQVAVSLFSMQSSKHFRVESRGYCHVEPDGSNRWVPGKENNQGYLIFEENASIPEISASITALMLGDNAQ